MENYLQAIVTVLSLVNPAVCGLMFSRIEAGRPRHAKTLDAARSCLAVYVILSLAALLGVRILGIFGVSLDAFRVAGGGVLAWIGAQMLAGDMSNSSAPTEDTAAPRSLSPLIMFAASPGTITGVITLAAAHTGMNFPATALVAVAVAALVTWCVLLAVAYAGGSQTSGGLVRDTVTKFMGLIIIAMGVQLLLAGYRSFMAAAP